MLKSGAVILPRKNNRKKVDLDTFLFLYAEHLELDFTTTYNNTKFQNQQPFLTWTTFGMTQDPFSAWQRAYILEFTNQTMYTTL